MKFLIHAFTVAGFVASGTVPALAQDMDPTSLTCGHFMALTPEIQAKVVGEFTSSDIENAIEDSPSAVATGSTVVATPTVSSGSETMMSTDTDTPVTAETNASGEVLIGDPEVAALKTACEGKEDALAIDQMESD